MIIELNKPEVIEGYKYPERICINKNIDIFLYIPLDKEADYIVGLHRKFNFNIKDQFLLHGDTMLKIFEKLYERGLA